MSHSKEDVFRLFMQKLSGCLSPEEESLLEQSLANDAAFRASWRELEEQVGRLPMQEFQEHLDVRKDLQDLKARIGDRNSRPDVRSAATSLKNALSIAAVFLILAVGAWLFFRRTTVINDKEKIAGIVKANRQAVSITLSNGRSVDLNDSNSNAPVIIGNTTLQAGKNGLAYTSADTTQSTLSVPAGASYRIILSDGTEVWLNAATTLRFPLKFGTRDRNVWLEGEGFFKVAADASRPFVVHTSLTRVHVLGTSFNINTYETGNVRTALQTGKVTTEDGHGKNLLLQPGFAADYQADKGFSTSAFEEDDELSWINGLYYFHDMPIVLLGKVASRFYGIHIIMDQQKLAKTSMTGLLDRNKLTDFLNDLETTAHIKYYYSGKDLHLE